MPANLYQQPLSAKRLAVWRPTSYHPGAMSARKTCLLILIFVFAAAVRLYALGRASFWYDEFDSLEASTGRGLAHLQLPVNIVINHPPDLTSLQNAPPPRKIWTSLDLDNHPPLYFVLLRLTREMLGDTEWAARLPSAICSLSALFFFFLIARIHLNDTIALAATALMAVAGSQITLAQEARPYALWLALSLACGWMVLRIERLGIAPRRWIALCLLACASLLTHYFAAAILFSLLMYAAIRLRDARRSGVLTALVCSGLLFAMVWGVFFLRQLRAVSANNAWQYDDDPHHLLRILWHLLQLPSRWLSEPAANLAALALLIGVVCVYGIVHCRRQPGMLFWLIWSVPLILLITATDIFRHAQSLMFMRYTFAVAPALFFLAGAFMQTHRRACIMPAALGILCLCTLPAAYSKVMDWRNVARQLQSQIRPGDTIIFTPGDNAVSWSQTTLLGIGHYDPHLPASALILTHMNPALFTQAFRSAHATWVICTDPTLPANVIDPTAKVVRTGPAPSMGRVSELLP